MKRRVLIVVLVLFTIFSVININKDANTVQACEYPLPVPDVPEPPLC